MSLYADKIIKKSNNVSFLYLLQIYIYRRIYSECRLTEKNDIEIRKKKKKNKNKNKKREKKEENKNSLIVRHIY